jgi:hypothetical protein
MFLRLDELCHGHGGAGTVHTGLSRGESGLGATALANQSDKASDVQAQLACCLYESGAIRTKAEIQLTFGTGMLAASSVCHCLRANVDLGI